MLQPVTLLLVHCTVSWCQRFRGAPSECTHISDWKRATASYLTCRVLCCSVNVLGVYQVNCTQISKCLYRWIRQEMAHNLGIHGKPSFTENLCYGYTSANLFEFFNWNTCDVYGVPASYLRVKAKTRDEPVFYCLFCLAVKNWKSVRLGTYCASRGTDVSYRGATSVFVFLASSRN